MNTLIEQFLCEEANVDVRRLIIDAISEHDEHSTEVKKTFDFNRFEVTLNFVSGVVKIEDVLDPSPRGETELPMEYLMARLQAPNQ